MVRHVKEARAHAKAPLEFQEAICRPGSGAIFQHCTNYLSYLNITLAARRICAALLMHCRAAETAGTLDSGIKIQKFKLPPMLDRRPAGSSHLVDSKPEKSGSRATHGATDAVRPYFPNANWLQAERCLK